MGGGGAGWTKRRGMTFQGKRADTPSPASVSHCRPSHHHEHGDWAAKQRRRNVQRNQANEQNVGGLGPSGRELSCTSRSSSSSWWRWRTGSLEWGAVGSLPAGKSKDLEKRWTKPLPPVLETPACDGRQNRGAQARSTVTSSIM